MAASEESRSQSGWAGEFYGETYKNPASEGVTNFQRLMGQWAGWTLPVGQILSFQPFLSTENYQPTNDRQNIRLEAGLKTPLGQKVTVIVSEQESYLNASSQEFNQIKAGVAAGDYRPLNLWKTFVEGYVEGFFFMPTDQPRYFATSGWLKYGYRAYEQNHLILDPIVLEARASDNSNRAIFGPDYEMVNLGARGNFWWSQPEFSTSLFVSRSWAWSRTAGTKTSDYWFAWSLGVRF